MNKRRLRTGRLSVRYRTSEDINPMDGIANLVDCMLVFACGLILALMVNWNVISDANKDALAPEVKESQSDMQAMEDVPNDAEDVQIENSQNLQEAGKVYIDPETGKWYFKEG